MLPDVEAIISDLQDRISAAADIKGLSQEDSMEIYQAIAEYCVDCASAIAEDMETE